jgi:hypothetical protein
MGFNGTTAFQIPPSRAGLSPALADVAPAAAATQAAMHKTAAGSVALMGSFCHGFPAAAMRP